jgi:hypothetical protein
MKGLKTGGRQKGTPNKLTSEIREKLNDYVYTEIDTLINNIDKIPIEKRLDLLTKILPYTIPKMSNIEVTSDNDINLDIEVSETEKQIILDRYKRMLN